MPDRKTWDEYFMDLAVATAARSTCPKARVGAVVVNDRNIVGTGYNGAPTGVEHCDKSGCLEIENHCFSVVHAEVNALMRAGNRVGGSTLYSTHRPCLDCCKLIVNAGVRRVAYRVPYLDSRCWVFGIDIQDEYLRQANVAVDVHRERVSGWG